MSPNPDPAALPPVNCLLVDDRDENLLALDALIASDDVRTLIARSGPEALELLLQHDVALALVDVQMPEMDGFELAEIMRGSERTRHVPLIFVTAGEHDRRRVFRGYESGAVDFLHKPIEPHVLKNKAQVFFDLHRMRERLAAQLSERTETLRFQETFTAMLGHDLRGPLSAMVMSAMVLGRKVPDEAGKQAAARIVQSGKRMSRMIDDLLDLARIRLGDGMPISRAPTDLDAVTLRVVEEQRAARPDRTVDYATTVEGGAATLEADADRLAQVVSNLVANALHHGAADAPVTVRLEGSDDELVLTVGNAGAVPPDVLPVMFEPFRQGRRQGNPSGGLGIGLYIVSQIVSAHGGSVHAHSADERTSITVRLPRRTNG